MTWFVYCATAAHQAAEEMFIDGNVGLDGEAGVAAMSDDAPTIVAAPVRIA